MKKTGKRIGEILLNLGIISEDQLVRSLKLQKERNTVLGQILIEEGFVREEQIIEVLELQFGIESIQLDKYNIDPTVPGLISEKMARRHEMIPVQIKDNHLVVAMTDPLNIFAIDDLKLATGYDITPLIASQKDMLLAIEQYYKKSSADNTVQEFSHSIGDYEIENNNLDDVVKLSNAPVVKLIDAIITQGADNKVSDIHIEPDESSVRIRFRIDGDLFEHMTLDKRSLSAIITRIKIMGHLNIAENRLPQDGRVEMEIGNHRIDLRISIMPTVYGEKVVLRLLDQSNKLMSLTEMGMSPDDYNKFHHIIDAPNGIILVTGPTGSGKTTTLYATLMELNDVKKNVITVEDPVEYKLKSINQTQVNDKAGLTFAKCLRSMLRQDPDIIMIGEVRDVETAQIAVRSAITGHLVLSTLHTNDTVSTIARLADMEIEPYLISSSIRGIVAQRLVKKICTNCKVSYEATAEDCIILGKENVTLHKGTGCNLCNHSGYRERTAIYEILLMTRTIKDIITNGGNTEQIRDAAIASGLKTLKDSCEALVLQGVTTIDEMLRLTSSID
ncbi:MAG: type II secretion system protein GspE [Firmicutes bacterium HGW-Firmicutes-3]|nr:MAG: type II secretion system protein GspE [Firmicutes bacterium HGW-Firmicutes-3]